MNRDVIEPRFLTREQAQACRTDMERLDWLEFNKFQVAFHQYGQPSERKLNKWAVWNCHDTRCEKLSTGDSARAAIDAAMDTEKRG